MKKRHLYLIILAILIIDQASKYYVKTHFYLGEDIRVLGNWFRLHFVENEGMAWGWKLGESGSWGKLALSVFRMAAVVFGVYYIYTSVKSKAHPGLLICIALIFAGAVGNLIDSMFYGLIFEASDPYAQNVAKMVPWGTGYESFLHGKVVDMLYFPLFHTTWPNWVPFVGGNDFEFFAPVFNIADTSISTGLIAILVFQKRFFNKPQPVNINAVETNARSTEQEEVM